MIQDIHSHTKYSFCAHDTPEKMIETAIKAGIEVYGICDHNYGIGYPDIDEFLHGKSVESGEYTEAELDAIRAVARDAQFYWDFVFVENSEGAHNSKLNAQCLDKAEALANTAMGMFK